ncbi:hypothetical protein chiPu_0005405 [Chiloscyllium punctatum]|uniref:Fibronectin type-III domain-containing protein n=1 Tax=Chiloscyllium punctatum TaxID=137246 RepID=A0A401S9D9_CHIPU|nr:hypothetical protein [Chiloscyllium punctatum]
MLHSKTKKIPINNTEITIGVVDVYTLEGTPRIGPSNINVTNISKTSAMIRWDPIPEDECQGFLQGYKIFYYVTKSAVGNIYSHDGEIKAIAVGISITIIIFVFLVTWRCLFLFRRIKEIFWPSIPNPGNSYVIRIIGKDSLLPQLDNELLSLKTNLPLMEDLESLHIIEEVTNTSTDCQLQENEENSVTDQDCNSNLSNKPAFIQYLPVIQEHLAVKGIPKYGDPGMLSIITLRDSVRRGSVTV